MKGPKWASVKSNVEVKIYSLLIPPDEENLRQKITKMMRDVMYLNKAPPIADPTLINGDEYTKSNKLLCLHYV